MKLTKFHEQICKKRFHNFNEFDEFIVEFRKLLLQKLGLGLNFPQYLVHTLHLLSYHRKTDFFLSTKLYSLLRTTSKITKSPIVHTHRTHTHTENS